MMDSTPPGGGYTTQDTVNYGPNAAGGPPRRKRRGAFIALVAAGCLAAGGIGGAAGAALMIPQSSQTTGTGTSELQRSTQTVSSTENAMSVAEISEKVGPSVVAITTTAQSAVPGGMFGSREEETSGAGSGIIVRADGYIVTNQHVVSGATSIKVTLQDAKEYDATVVGTDSQTDIAILKINASGLTPATLGDSEKLVTGETAVAIGNPLGELANTVTVGVISALDREITIDGQTMSLLQTDAAINPGNSGGALINAYGEVIGINTAKTSAVGVEGLGFAIPINDVKSVIDEIIAQGYVSGRTMIGISTQDISGQALGNGTAGVYVVSVEPGSAAEKAGIQAGDVIVAFDGQNVTTTAEINALKQKHSAGDKIAVTVVRDGQTVNLTVTLAAAN